MTKSKPGRVHGEAATPPVGTRQRGLRDWQLERIKAGLEDMHAGRVYPADEVFAEIAAEHGWKR